MWVSAVHRFAGARTEGRGGCPMDKAASRRRPSNEGGSRGPSSSSNDPAATSATQAVERLARPAQMVPVLVRVCAAALKGAPEVGEHVLRAHAAQNSRASAWRLQQDDLVEPRGVAERGQRRRRAIAIESSAHDATSSCACATRGRAAKRHAACAVRGLQLQVPQRARILITRGPRRQIV